MRKPRCTMQTIIPNMPKANQGGNEVEEIKFPAEFYEMVSAKFKNRSINPLRKTKWITK